MSQIRIYHWYQYFNRNIANISIVISANIMIYPTYMFVHIISLYITKVSAVNIEICKFLTVSCLEKGENTKNEKYLKQYSPADEKTRSLGCDSSTRRERKNVSLVAFVIVTLCPSNVNCLYLSSGVMCLLEYF